MHLPPIFNCSNDMALAANVCQYMPPKRIQQMEADLAPLAKCWESGPWGWSLATRQRYRQMGVAASELPSDEWLANVRRLSSREFACTYIQQLLKEVVDEKLIGHEMRFISPELNAVEDALKQLSTATLINKSSLISHSSSVIGHQSSIIGHQSSVISHQSSVISHQSSVINHQSSVINHWSSVISHQSSVIGHQSSILQAPSNEGRAGERALIFKSPWSSSGRGVFVASELTDSVVKRLKGYVSSQGGFAVDTFYADKAVDFAMEFFVHECGDVEFLGYSVFHAAASGAYGYNIVASQQQLKQMIGADESLLQQLIDYHKQHLGRLGYAGPVGIDMLRCADGRIHPCIEINLRMNMGILAINLWNKYHDEHLTIALTPPRANGFQAKVSDGCLSINYMQ